MTEAGDEAGDRVPRRASGASATLAFVVAGVLQEGDAAPRLRYRAAGEGYDDACTVAGQVVAIDGGVVLRFPLPARAVDFILIEPAVLPGTYRIPRMAWAGERVADLRRRVISVDGRADDHVCPEGVCIVSGRGGPAVELDVRGLGNGGVADIELVLQRDSDGVTVEDAIARLAGRMVTDADMCNAGIARLGRVLTSTSERIGEVVDAVQSMGAAQGELDARVEALVAAQRAMEQRIATLEAATLDGQVSLRALIERTAGERVAAEAAATASASIARESAARDREGVKQALAGLQAQLDRVTNAVENVFWRRWLRRLRTGGR